MAEFVPQPYSSHKSVRSLAALAQYLGEALVQNAASGLAAKYPDHAVTHHLIDKVDKFRELAEEKAHGWRLRAAQAGSHADTAPPMSGMIMATASPYAQQPVPTDNTAPEAAGTLPRGRF